MDEMLIELLNVVSEELSRETKEKKDWRGFGNSYGQAETKKFLLACSEVLKTIAEAL